MFWRQFSLLPSSKGGTYDSEHKLSKAKTQSSRGVSPEPLFILHFTHGGFVVFSCYVWPRQKAGGWDFTVLKQKNEIKCKKKNTRVVKTTASSLASGIWHFKKMIMCLKSLEPLLSLLKALFPVICSGWSWTFILLWIKFAFTFWTCQLIC